MAEKFEEVKKIEETRDRISEKIKLLSGEKSLTEIIKENPAAATVSMLVIGILTAFVSKKIIEIILKLITYGLKIAAFFYFVRQSLPFITKIKDFKNFNKIKPLF